MAIPIADTPILKGIDAENFLKRAAESEAGMHKISDEEFERIKKNAEMLIKNAKFTI